MSSINDDKIRQMTFGRFAGDNGENNNSPRSETETGTKYEPVSNIKSMKKEETIPREAFTENIPKRKRTSKKKQKRKKEDQPEPIHEPAPLWTGQTTAIDIIAPSSVDTGSRDYIVVDGIYHAYLYIAGYGYRTRNEAAWLSSLAKIRVLGI